MNPSPKRQTPTLVASEVEARAVDELRRIGFNFDPANVVGDGVLRRCDARDRPGKLDCWYAVHADEWPCLVCGDWREGGQDVIPLWDHAGRPLSLEERHAMEAAMTRRREAREAETRRKHEDAASRAKADLARARDAGGDFPYLVRKGVSVVPGLKYDAKAWYPKRGTNPGHEEPALLVPLTNAQGEIRSYQRIFADGFKAHMGGGEKTALFHEFPGRGDAAGFMILGEGFATCRTLSMVANGATVISCCDKGNIMPVAKALREAGRLDPARTLIVADNDWETGRREYLKAKAEGRDEGFTPADYNPGLQAAKQTAELLGCRWTLAVPDEAIYPTGETATDANDLYLAKRADCLQAGMHPEDAERIAMETVAGMLDRGWGIDDRQAAKDPEEAAASTSADIMADLDLYSPGAGVYAGPPPAYSWGFEWLMEQGELAVLGGPGGAGKSTVASQAVLAMATGQPWLGWYHVGGDPGEGWYLSSEDSQRTLHRRIASALEVMSPRNRELAMRYARFRSLPSRYTLFRQDSRTKAVVPTDFWPSFRAKVLERRPRLLVLDPLSAVTRIAETDNTAMGDALDYLEELADESGACILYLHHTQKAPSLLKDSKAMEETLDQSAIRGAGAIVNTPRMAMLMYPLSVKLAQQCLLDASEVKSNGQIVVCKEVKKNGGMLAPARFFKHTSRMGLLEPCLNVRPKADLGDPSEGRAILRAQSLEEHARRLAEMVVAREQEEATPRRRIAVTGVCVCMGMGDSRDKSRAIALQAQELGLVRPVLLRDMVAAGLTPKTQARGEVLVPTAEALRRHGRPDPARPGEYLNIPPELRTWIEGRE